MSKTSQDTEAKWILDYGVEWSEWQQSISNWLSQQTKSMSPRLTAISIFFKSYLYDNALPKNFIDFFSNTDSFPDLYTTMKAELSNHRTALYRYNIIMDLLNSIIMEHFSYIDEFGKPIPKISNPFPILDDENYSPAVKSIETTYSSLPLKYIKELRGIICPETKGDFKDWLWAIDSSDRGDWFDVQDGIINLDDPDCVWRTNGKRKQLWCPVKAMVIYLKLHLPLRTYQTRMLDSGEADYYRYSKGLWSVNTTHLFANPRKSISKGFFHKMTDRATGLDIVGMFISTNKTQDINKDEVDRGYAIPWQHEEVLYWVEKLRNWQENYNPISKPTKFLELDTKHLGLAKSKDALRKMGSQCFLMRNAAASKEEDKDKPVNARSIPILWHALLSKLEENVEQRSQFTGEKKVKLVKNRIPVEGPRRGLSTEVFYPLHSLRVALLTAYAIDGGVPTPILSKLIAGHSRLIMTLHYLKVSPSAMSELLSEAEAKIKNSSDVSFKDFLVNSDIHSAMQSIACIDTNSVTQVLSEKLSIGWEQKSIGICLAASNNTAYQQSDAIRCCSNGYKTITEKRESYGPVPNGPENCVRCRWFVTEARFLHALKCHFNLTSYKASESAALALEIENELQALERERIDAFTQNISFNKIKMIESTENRLNKQLSTINEYACDMNACFTLIGRLLAIEENRQVNDKDTKLVAIGSVDDLKAPLSIIETNSKLWQLVEISESALIYPDIADDFLNSSGLHELAGLLDAALMDDGCKPYFLRLSNKAKLIATNAMIEAISHSQNRDDNKDVALGDVCKIIESGQLPSKEFFDRAILLTQLN